MIAKIIDVVQVDHLLGPSSLDPQAVSLMLPVPGLQKVANLAAGCLLFRHMNRGNGSIRWILTGDAGTLNDLLEGPYLP